MRLVELGVLGVGVACIAGCSWSSGTVAHPTFASTETPTTGQTTAAAGGATCKRTAPVADTAIGAGSIGVALAGTGFAVFGDSDARPYVMGASIALLGAGIAFLASSRDGFADHDACNRELLAMQRPGEKEPLHIVVTQVGVSCEQRRLDMYTRAVTGVDDVQRAQLLAELPTCASESASREKAWTLTKNASLAASAGKCDEVEPLARQVYDLDVALHDVVMLSDIEIKFCLSRREL